MKDLIVRPATKADMPAIVKCHGEIEQAVGQLLDLPDVDDAAILDYWVVERDGEVIGGLYLEKSIRQCHFGTDPEATAALAQHEIEILAASRAAGVRFAHCSVFNDLPTAENISRHLKALGYEPRPDLLDHMRDLRRTA
jgi:hypothetical protein